MTKSSQLTAVNRVRPVLGGMVPQVRTRGLCNLSLDPSAIASYPGGLEQAINLPEAQFSQLRNGH